MPVQLVWETRGVYRRYAGDVTIRERLESFNAICADPRFDELRYAITDYRAAREYEIDAHETELIAAMHVAPLRTNPRIVMAAVAERPDIVAAIRHFIALGFTSQPYCIFGTLDEARAWVATQTARPGYND